jgi:hypothetical protein
MWCLCGPRWAEVDKEKGSTNGSTFMPFTVNLRIPMLLIQLDTKGPKMPVVGIQ